MNKSRKSDKCLNCGTSLNDSDHFCPNCGQENQDKKVPVKTLLLDFLGDYFTFDSKLFRSLVPLIFKPGFLTNEFNSGKRVRYIPPLRMYIFISIIYFFIAGITKPLEDKKEEAIHENRTDTLQGLTLSMKTGMVNFDFGGSNVNYTIDDLEEISKDEKKTKELLDSMQVEKTPFKIFATKIILKQVVKFKKQKESFSSYFIRNISLAMFFLMPLLAGILKLVYRKAGKFYIEHLIFSFHFHSFVFLISVISELAGDNLIKMIVIALIFAYFFFALAKVYPQSFFKTLFKGMAVSVMYIFSLATTMILTMLFSFLFF